HIVSRNPQAGEQLATELNAIYTKQKNGLEISADIIIIAVADAGIEECIPKLLPDSDTILLHTAGSVGKEVFLHKSRHYGVLYPLQSLRKESKTIPEVPFLIDADSQHTLSILQTFVNSLSLKVRIAGDEERLKLHVAAVFVSNFTNHLYAVADALCKKEHLDFDLLKPLIRETATRLDAHSPSEVQTGPAKRKDMLTIEKHLKVLSAYPEWEKLYIKLSESIMGK
ncbi:MAG: DUF2520 domain-containing protein, partial [Ferruginibacter sp.]|nr:DUF2520 domain-containing protein [Ferruginibacter sp.]